MSRQQILSLLYQSQDYLSGEEMSRRLGISRAAVWKAVDALRQEGYEIDSQPRRGYRLLHGPDLLQEGEIRPYLTGGHIPTHLEVFSSIDSTNNYLKREAHHLPHGAAAVADQQTGGRGRLGRSFSSPSGMGIYCSVLLRPNLPPAQVTDLTAFVAVAVCDAIEAACGQRPQIKWTNDIIMANRKVCGILTEMTIEGESGALQHIVTGIGINAAQQPSDWPEELREIAGSVSAATGKPVRRGYLTACLLNALDEMYTHWLNGERTRYLEQYRKDCITVGREVRLMGQEGEQIAFAEGIDDRFGLIVRFPDGTKRTVTTGEVSVRGLYGYV